MHKTPFSVTQPKSHDAISRLRRPNVLYKTFLSLKKRGFLPTILIIAEYPFGRLVARHKANKILRHADIEERFTEIYRSSYWNSAESVSGGGSTLSYTEKLRKGLPDLFAKFSIASIFDAPCGDFNWMRYVIEHHSIDYIGGDIVSPLILSLKERYETNNRRFIHIDLTKSQFPAADLMICRDCLFHLSYDDTQAVLENFLRSDIPYLLTSTHVNSTGLSNKDIKTGDFRLIDLFSAPYNFPQDVLYRIPDWREPGPQREMCLWSREQIGDTLKNFNHSGWRAL